MSSPPTKFSVALALVAIVIAGCVGLCEKERNPQAQTGVILAANAPRLPQEPFTTVGEVHLPGRPRDILLSGGEALVALNREGVCRVDVRRPEAMKVTGHHWTPTPLFFERLDDFTLISTVAAGLGVWDFSDFDKPVQIAHYPTTGPVYGMAVRDSRILATQGRGGVTVLDWDRSKKALAETGKWPMKIQFARDLTFLDRRHVILSDTFGHAALTVRVKSGAGARVVSTATIPELNVDHVTLVDKVGYITARDQVSVVDYRRPRCPRMIGVLWRGPEGKVNDCVLRGHALFVLRDTAGVDIYDVTDPREPAFVAHSDALGNVSAMAFGHRLIYVGDWDQGLRAVRPHPLLFKLMNPEGSKATGSQ